MIKMMTLGQVEDVGTRRIKPVFHVFYAEIILRGI
jgi:hypothetical protein